jgi:hypothetical protein
MPIRLMWIRADGRQRQTQQQITSQVHCDRWLRGAWEVLRRWSSRCRPQSGHRRRRCNVFWQSGTAHSGLVEPEWFVMVKCKENIVVKR